MKVSIDALGNADNIFTLIANGGFWWSDKFVRNSTAFITYEKLYCNICKLNALGITCDIFQEREIK